MRELRSFRPSRVAHARISVRVAVVTASLLAVACGARRGASYPDAPPPATIEEAQRQIERARADLGLPPASLSRAPSMPAGGVAAADVQSAPVVAPAAPPAPRAETTAPTSAAPTPTVQASEETGSATSSSRGSRCERACRAFASMQRASDALCRLAGEADVRCVEARRAVRESESVVSGCGC